MGVVYVIESESGPIKIGVAGSPFNRLSELQTSSPFKLNLKFAGECEDPVAIEKLAHSKLAKVRMRGEWFKTDAITAQTVVRNCADELRLPINECDLTPVRKVRAVPTGREQKLAAVNLRMSPSVKALAETRADADGRSVANYIERLIIKDAELRGKQ